MNVIVITGANRGIGLALTKLFSEDHTVYALCRSEFPAAELNANIMVVRLDVTDQAAVGVFVNSLEERSVAVDLLINNAGIAGGEEAVDVSYAGVSRVFDVNCIGPMLLSINLLPALKRSPRPVMFAISSRMGTHALLDEYNAEWWPYSSSKAALNLAVSAFAINEPGIKAISIHPGWVKTSMGGADADIEPTESAKGIKQLYDSIDSLESGLMYSYEGKVMAW